MILLSFLVLYPAASALAIDTPASENPFSAIGIDQKLNAQVPPDLQFRDESGRAVRLGDYFGDKPIILNLVYYQCPMLCNMTMDGLIRTLRTMSFDAGREFTIVTVSFDAREGPHVAAGAKRTALKRYGRDSAESGWHFLTGDEAAIEQLTETVGFRYTYDDRLDQFAHAAGLMVLTPEGRISRYLNGIEFASRDLRLSLVEASENRIGSATDQILLLCYQYNPATGKYGFVIQSALRISGLATVGAIVGGIIVMLRRERRQQRTFDVHGTAPEDGGPPKPAIPRHRPQ